MVLRVSRLSKSFSGVRAVDDVSLEVEPRRITAIIGPNGAGKSTLLNLITGFLLPDAGKVYLFGEDITYLPPHARAARGMVRTFQDLRLIEQLSVLENVLVACPRQRGEHWLWSLLGGWRDQELRCREVAEQWLQWMGLADKLDSPAGSLSYGQQKLLMLACCFASGASLILLDEPVAGIDPHLTERITTFMHEAPKLGKTIVFIEHNIDVVQRIAEHVFVMAEGKVIASGCWNDVANDAKVLEVYLS